MVLIHYRTSKARAFLRFKDNEETILLQMSDDPERRNWKFVSSNFLGCFKIIDEENQETLSFEIDHDGEFAIYDEKLIEIETNNQKIMLLSDLDNTLVGYNEVARSALIRFNEYWIRKHLFSGSKLVYNTGRDFCRYISLLNDGFELLEPDLLITGAGVEAYTIDKLSGEYILHENISDLYDLEHWDSSTVQQIIAKDFPWLYTPAENNVHKLKIWMKANMQDFLLHSSALKLYFKNHENLMRYGKIIKAKIIIAGDNLEWKNFHITAQNGGKNTGVAFAKAFFNFEEKYMIAAGDSGNDIDMFKGEIWGIIVGNYEEELGAWLNKKPRINKIISNYSFADGIIDGIQKITKNMSNSQ
ncbi:unnamed protein product [Blepharisma stoltei]|uniref:Sucrose phosphatase-like domain-containing protein n=1 Tax=Blepharisma stoltei TaxID=1481888 RepID=A0AAU9K1H7_9CILI|nr:unnamed protein product [Blepharisma stoltei]